MKHKKEIVEIDGKKFLKITEEEETLIPLENIIENKKHYQDMEDLFK